MTCRGYDPKAVKISKTVKRMASTHRDKNQRRAYIRSYVEVAVNELRAGRKEK